MFVTTAGHDRIVATLAQRATLGEHDAEAIRRVAVGTRDITAGSYMVREGQFPERCAILLTGYAYRQKLAIDGERALVALRVPGDFLDLQNLFLRESDHDVQALTDCTVADFSLADMRMLAGAHAAINAAAWGHVLVEGSISREWLLNLGRRSARVRIAHLLCELSARLEASTGVRETTYMLPMTQEQLGDALGLTAVHVNRVLRGLEEEGLITRRKREITVADRARLRRAADFNERYLHLPH